MFHVKICSSLTNVGKQLKPVFEYKETFLKRMLCLKRTCEDIPDHLNFFSEKVGKLKKELDINTAYDHLSNLLLYNVPNIL